MKSNRLTTEPAKREISTLKASDVSTTKYPANIATATTHHPGRPKKEFHL